MAWRRVAFLASASFLSLRCWGHGLAASSGDSERSVFFGDNRSRLLGDNGTSVGYGAGACPSPWVQIGSHCFWLSSDSHSFETCQAEVCGPKGATLACVRQSEFYMLAGLMDSDISEGRSILAAWIGFTEAGLDEWRWINGCPSTFTNWRIGDPDDYCGGEDCAAITGRQGAFLDVSCRLRLPCLCELGSAVVPAYNLTVSAQRDDTCYADCGDITKWCSAWPFLRLFDVDDDVCHWEGRGQVHRGRGASECASRAAALGGCGNYISYAVGRCRCSPAAGPHANCTHRKRDFGSDIFRISADGTQLVLSGQRCVYTLAVDEDYFASLDPGGQWGQFAGHWFRAAAVWLAVGVPCGVVMLCVMRFVCCRCPGHFSGSKLDSSSSSVWDRQGGGQAGMDTSYGPIMDTAVDMHAGEAVNKWICRGAFGVMLYGFALLGLGATLAQSLGTRMSFGFARLYVELLEALVMAVSKAAVARAAFMVRRKLAEVPRQVVGPWILVLALSKLAMCLTAFGGVLIFVTLVDNDYENVCYAGYMFRWSLLLALPFQCISGVALWRIHVRVARYSGGGARVDGWVALLVFGTFASGSGVWWAGYVDSVHEVGIIVAVCFILAALGQLLAGVSVMFINWKVKMYIRQRIDDPQEGEDGAFSVTPIGLGRASDEMVEVSAS